MGSSLSKQEMEFDQKYEFLNIPSAKQRNNSDDQKWVERNSEPMTIWRWMNTNHRFGTVIFFLLLFFFYLVFIYLFFLDLAVSSN